MLPDVAEVTLFGYELDVVARVLPRGHEDPHCCGPTEQGVRWGP